MQFTFQSNNQKQLPLQVIVDLGTMAMKGYIPQNSRAGASPSDGLISYPGH